MTLQILILGNVLISINKISHLLYLFTFKEPTYRIRFDISQNLSTKENTFRSLAYAIYNESLKQVGRRIKVIWIEIDEGLFGVPRKMKKEVGRS